MIALRSRELNAQHSVELAFATTQSEAQNFKEAVNRLFERQREVTQALAARAQEQISSGRLLLFALAIAAFILAIMSGWYVLRAVTRPLRELVSANGRGASG